MKIMYISRRFSENICATMHYRAILELFGENNVITVDISLKNLCDTKNCMSFESENTLGRIEQFLKLYPRWTSKSTIAKICDTVNKENIKIVYIDEGFFGQLSRKLKVECSVKVVTFSHDIAKVMYKERLIDEGIRFLPEYLCLCRGEYLNTKYADSFLVLNKRDGDLFRDCYGKTADDFLKMGVATPHLDDKKALEFSFFRTKHNEKYLVFIGTCYQPNLRGLKWFVENVFYSLQEKYHLVVVGRGLEKLKAEYTHERIHVIGGVGSLAPYYNNADIVVAPVFGGGGMKQKTAEAFAYGRCVVGTVESFQGYEEELTLTHDGCKVVFASDSAEEQIGFFQYIEEHHLYGYMPELNQAFHQKYSKDSLIKVFSKHLQA